MDDRKWTQGDWYASGYRVEAFRGRDEDGADYWENVAELENERDAHLIAAAPDLYAALDAARIILAEHEPHPLPVLAQALAALAKARGER